MAADMRHVMLLLAALAAAAIEDSFGDPYAILNVARDSSTESIVKAYRLLARRHHPDKAGGDDTIFRRIASAYDILKNATTREILDRLGEDGIERLRNGDPSVRKGWLSPEEVPLADKFVNSNLHIVIDHLWRCCGVRLARTIPLRRSLKES